jgi:hypothetical protein
VWPGVFLARLGVLVFVLHFESPFSVPALRGMHGRQHRHGRGCYRPYQRDGSELLPDAA